MRQLQSTWALCVYTVTFHGVQIEELTAGFNQAHGIPQCISAWMEHMEIQQPSTNSMDYMNRKGKSLNIQATRDYR